MHSCWSLLEEDDHWIADVEAYVAAVIVRYGVAALLNDEAMPIAFKLSIKLVLDLSGNVAEVRLVVVLKCLQSCYDCALDLILGHVSAFD